MAELGAGPAPIPHRQLTARKLAAAIMAAVSDEAMQASAAVLGDKIEAEQGAARAAEVLGQALR